MSQFLRSAAFPPCALARPCVARIWGQGVEQMSRLANCADLGRRSEAVRYVTRRPVRIALLVLLCSLCAAFAWAEAPAVLKLQVQLDAGVIKVSDLWGGVGATGETVIGPAPPPGRTIAIEAGQLAYIARLYDVNWRPVSGVERTSVVRAGRPLTRDEMSDPVRRALGDAGAPASATVEFSNFTPILVPPSSFPLLSIEAIAYDQAAERFSADIVASCEGMQPQRMRVAGRVLQMVTAVVATHRLQPTDVIGLPDVRVAQVAERRLAGPVLADVAQALGQAPKRTIVSGQALMAADIGPPVMVAKGDTVVVVLETSSMSMAVQGLALDAGGRDDIVQVMNPLSRAVVAARVTGPGRTVVAPGSAPLVAPPGLKPRNSQVAN